MTSRECLKDKKRIVIKVGTTSITHENGKMNLSCISGLSWVLTDLMNMGKEIILVSSGAIGVGSDKLKLKSRPEDIREKQAASSVGQAILMQMYESFFMSYNQVISQILLTKDVLEDGLLKENARNTFFKLIEWGVIPIVNENDTVSVEELGFSDNDSLSAAVAVLTDSDLLIILSDIEGLYESDPRENPNARLIPRVDRIDNNIMGFAGDSKSGWGTGGMATKIGAAKTVTNAGIDMIIAKGEDPVIILDLLNGEEKGTFFCRKEDI